MIRCLALDWSHDVTPPLADLFRLSASLVGEESLLLCLSPRTWRIFPQLEAWAREEGLQIGIWLAETDDSPERKSDWVLTGCLKPELTFRGESQDFVLATHPGEFFPSKRTALGT